MSETNEQAKLRLAAAQDGVMLLRNNVGAAQDDTGRLIRYGLANDSKKMQAEIKSADLVGITPYTIRPEDVGKTVGIFTSVEVKVPGWRMTGTDHEMAQAKWARIVRSKGGLAGFAWDLESMRSIYGSLY